MRDYANAYPKTACLSERTDAQVTSLVPAANTCTCKNGIGATAAQCPKDGESKCVSCNRGYDLQMDNTCVGSFSIIVKGVAQLDMVSGPSPRFSPS